MQSTQADFGDRVTAEVRLVRLVLVVAFVLFLVPVFRMLHFVASSKRTLVPVQFGLW